MSSSSSSSSLASVVALDFGWRRPRFLSSSVIDEPTVILNPEEAEVEVGGV